jgi:AcrR family transcriptional regulator
MTTPTDAPPEADPRIVRTRSSVLRAATDLLVEGGPSAVTMDAIVARSGVAKSTIYRHWPSRDDVLVDVFAACAPDLEPPPGELTFEPALRSFVASIVSYFLDPQWARIIPALLLLKTHEDGVADLEKRLEKNQSDAMASIIERGIAEGAIPSATDVDEAIAHVVGPLLFAQLTGSVPLDHAFGERTVDRFLAAYARVR